MDSLQYSIIIPVYNAESTVVQTVESVLNQTVGGYEIILVNDGSTDLSGKILDELADKYEAVKVFHQDNQGPNYGRYTGIKNASGNYLMFLDADDLWDNDLLENINKYNNDYDLVIYNARIISDGKTIYDKPIFDIDGESEVIDKDTVLHKTYFSSDNNAIWKKAFKRALFTEEMLADTFDLRTSEDLILSVRMVQASNTVLYIDKCMYNHIDNPSGITNNIRLSDINDTFFVRAKILEKISDEREKEQYAKYIQKRVAGMAIQICENGKNREKIELLKAIRENNIDNLIKYTDSISELSVLYRIVIKLLYKEKYRMLLVYSRCFLLLKKLFSR